MWHTHFIVIGALTMLALIVLVIDYWLLRPTGGGFISLDLRGMLIIPYSVWLGCHLAGSSLAIYVWPQKNVYLLHGISAAVTIPLAILLMYILIEKLKH